MLVYIFCLIVSCLAIDSIGEYNNPSPIQWSRLKRDADSKSFLYEVQTAKDIVHSYYAIELYSNRPDLMDKYYVDVKNSLETNKNYFPSLVQSYRKTIVSLCF